MEQQVEFPVVYDGQQINGGLRIDLIVNNVIVVELKAVEKHNRLYEAQLLPT